MFCLLGPERAGGKLCPPFGLCLGVTLVPSIGGGCNSLLDPLEGFKEGTFLASLSNAGTGRFSNEGIGDFCNYKKIRGSFSLV